MWAAYYQQYYQQAGGMAATGASAASSGGDEESVYHQWIEYYKAYGMTKEMEQMEQKLKEFQSNKKSVSLLIWKSFVLILFFLEEQWSRRQLK